jgi:hypothetical protein
MRVFGKQLKVGDTIEVWWTIAGYKPRQDTITSLEPYRGPLKIWKEGAQIAGFALSRVGMTIDNGDIYEVITSNASIANLVA